MWRPTAMVCGQHLACQPRMPCEPTRASRIMIINIVILPGPSLLNTTSDSVLIFWIIDVPSCLRKKKDHMEKIGLEDLGRDDTKKTPHFVSCSSPQFDQRSSFAPTPLSRLTFCGTAMSKVRHCLAVVQDIRSPSPARHRAKGRSET